MAAILKIYIELLLNRKLTQFCMEHLCLAGTKVYIIGPGHMTKKATMLIYGKNPLKIFFSRTMSDDLETWH